MPPRFRIELRPPCPGDQAAFLAAMRASLDLHHPWNAPPTTPAAYARLLERAAGDRHRTLLVCRRADRAITGYVNVNEIIRGPFQNAFLGYGAVAEHAGRGYMTEGLALTVRYAFIELGLHRLEANIQPRNARSIALVRRCGFTHEGSAPRYLKVAGRWRDHEHWVLRAEQWRAARGR